LRLLRAAAEAAMERQMLPEEVEEVEEDILK
jgi:hypothetical protein